jgi:hypothetical protein
LLSHRSRLAVAGELQAHNLQASSHQKSRVGVSRPRPDIGMRTLFGSLVANQRPVNECRPKPWTTELASIANGDESAFGMLYEATYQAVLFYALSITNDADDAREIVLTCTFMCGDTSKATMRPKGQSTTGYACFATVGRWTARVAQHDSRWNDSRDLTRLVRAWARKIPNQRCYTQNVTRSSTKPYLH